MYDIPTYDHSKPDLEPEFKPSFYHYAAKISLFAPVLSLIFIKSLVYGLKDVPPPWGTLITAALGFLLAFIFLVSLALALVALAGIPRHGTEGILVRSLLGMLVSLVLLGIWGMNFVHGFRTALQNRKAANSLNQTLTEANDNLKKEIAQKGALGPDAGKDNAQKIKNAFDKASTELTGNAALAAKAGSAYIAKMQGLVANYTAAAQAIKSPPALNMSGVQRREDLAAKKELVNKFMDANEKLMAFFTKAEDVFRNELVRVKLPAAEIETELKGYRRTATDRNFLILKIRMTDQRIGTAMLGMLDTLDTSWGNWKYSPKKKNVIFQDTAAVAKYNEYFRNMNAAAKEQAELQAELLNLPATASTQ